jgi:acetylornithine/N-succinyldiaminopimelate aminotransferase
MAVGSAVLDIVSEPAFLAKVAMSGATLAQSLEGVVARHGDAFEERRGIGHMQGLRCRVDPATVVSRLREAGLLVAPAQDRVIRLLPPLIVGAAEIAEATSILDDVARKF